MSEPIVIPPGGGEVVGDSPDRRVEILSDHEALHATWSRFGPRRDGADLHVHHRHTDLFYVLEGELTLRLGLEDQRHALAARTLAWMPPLVVHGFLNGGDEEVRYLNLHAPGQGFAEFMRGIRDGRKVTYDQHDPPADGGRPITEATIGPAEVDLEEIAVHELGLEPGELGPQAREDRHEWLYVLAGELVVEAGDRPVAAPAGAWVQLPGGAQHSISVSGGDPARCLSVSTPAA